MASAEISRVVTKPATSRLTTTQVLPTDSAKCPCRGEGLVAGLVAAHQLAEGHHRHRREEVRADDRLRPGGHRRDPGDRDGRGVGGEHGARRAPAGRARANSSLLDLQALEDRLDDEVGLGSRSPRSVVVVIRPSAASASSRVVVPLPTNRSSDRAIAGRAARQRLVRDVAEGDPVARPPRRPGRSRSPSARRRSRRASPLPALAHSDACSAMARRLRQDDTGVVRPGSELDFLWGPASPCSWSASSP